jgi:hypothetical protein
MCCTKIATGIATGLLTTGWYSIERYELATRENQAKWALLQLGGTGRYTAIKTAMHCTMQPA